MLCCSPMKPWVLGAILWTSILNAQVTTQLSTTHDSEIEKERLISEQVRTELEITRTKWTALATLVPVLVAAATVLYGVWSVRRTVENQTMTKLAELALAGHVPEAMAARAELLAQMFKGSLPKKFETAVREFEAKRLKTNT